ncbi:TolC family protein [Sulfurimonas autotrophica]|uniref:Outer membrane efflux protein n=1 Tax=Sulfurimonas autotrophica (strain ATCC BAA-671 / DSM 16294 / JCM 11897 / OK10) TaxID=563040 RepID=E0UTS5_SULAO|nr:TolC family protein [Sulfurimonas autotrophica]ADN09369.1 outer membrane efflux protein [Sulfurimonas autotrophica DSM 16294]
MKKLLLLGIVPALLFGDDLKSLLDFAKENNNLVNASKISVAAKEKEVKSATSNYFPTLDASAFYKRDDDASPFQPGTTYGANAKIGFDIYDGGKKSYTKQQKENEHKSASFTYKDTKKSILLSITQDYYNLKSLNSSLEARIEASKAVKAQLERMQHFYEAELATSDDVDRLQSAYDSNIYAIESIKFQITAVKKGLELKVGKKISSLENSSFEKTVQETQNELDSIQALKYTKTALQNLSETIDSYYYPTIHIEETYTVYGYQDKPVLAGQPIQLLNNQNEVMATVGIRLFDFGTLKEQKEAVKLQADALNQQIIYKSKEQQMQLELALQRIHTAELNIKSSKSALKAAKSALKTITEKYNAGIVDNVVYLDALSSKTEAKATYEKSLNDLEIAYGIYYYYNNKNLEEFIK